MAILVAAFHVGGYTVNGTGLRKFLSHSLYHVLVCSAKVKKEEIVQHNIMESCLLAKVFVICTCLVAANGFARYSEPQVTRYNGRTDPGDPLILTKYIKEDKIDDGILA